ncbi:MAG: electron transfer flavoprotein beta subunit/FixA family protein [Bacteroidetes bacterium]|nr:MAG: electron transfer flavoprotein beta subunit/FixA family protein [Bacteroidota bacterium]MBL1143984.1 electron transfer flavoprotein beta subunit/FixA family protein [Bacteroidota bacterium]MCB0802021.1 electron transfer flavoprotein subunit beta/FixA family protein [Flavobacteriales bacterium]NOG56785.1 electron transfer flavoprotein subunit beta/FixA family protein [Bacteroidota bacterium]
MKILVCISKVPDTTSKIAFTDGNSKFDTNGVQFIINPYDEWYALVRALELKEANGGSVTVINVGLADNDPTIRKALAIGADDAVRVNLDPKDAMDAAQQIADYASANGYELVLCGKETIDYNGSQMGGMIAAILNQEFISNATKLDMNGNTATIERDIQGGTEVLELNIPFVVSAAKGMAEARIPNMRGIMAARTKPLTVVEPSASFNATEVLTYELPPAKGSCKMISADNPAELLDLLRNEAKIL